MNSNSNNNYPYNLRRAVTGGYQGTGMPKAIFTDGPHEILPGLKAIHPDGSHTCFARVGTILRAYHSKLGATDVTEVAGPVAGIVVDQTLWLFSSGAAPRRFEWRGESWEETPHASRYVPVMLERLDMGVVSVGLGGVTLEQEYDTRSRIPTTADSLLVGHRYEQAYTQLRDQTRSQGGYIQPVLVRYLLIAHDGSTLYASAPVIISDTSGLQAVSIDASVGPSHTFTATLSAKAFRVGTRISRPFDALFSSSVAEVRVEVLAELDPFVAGRPSLIKYTGQVSTSVAALTFYLPGYNPALEAVAPGSPLRDRLFEALTKIGPQSPIHAPHSFTATRAATHGDSVLYSGVATIPFSGYSLPELLVATDPSLMQAPTAVKVTMADGSEMAVTGTLSARTPSSISPLLAYPSAEARSITIYTPTGSEIYPLTPSPCGRWAVYLSADCRAMPVSVTGITADEAAEALADLCVQPPSVPLDPEVVAVADASDPLTVQALSRSEAGPVVALAPAPRPGSGWGATRPAFYAMGQGGIALVSRTSASRLSAQLIHSGPVSDPRAVALVPGGVAALAGGALVCLSGSKATVLAHSCRGHILGYSPSHSELWISSDIFAVDDPPVLVYDMINKELFYRTGISPTGFVTLPGRMLAACSDGTMRDASDELSICMCKARLDRRISPPPRQLTIPLYGRSLSGTVILYADAGCPDTPARPVATLRLAGDLSSPPSLRLPPLRCRAMRLAIDVSTLYPNSLRYVTPV